MIGIYKTLYFHDDENVILLKLQGVVYFGLYHFTYWIIDSNGTVWFHDGMTTGEACVNEGILQDYTNREMEICRGHRQQLLCMHSNKKPTMLAR